MDGVKEFGVGVVEKDGSVVSEWGGGDVECGGGGGCSGRCGGWGDVKK